MFFPKALVLNPYPQTLFPRKGAILLGLPPLDPVGGFAPATPYQYLQEVFHSLKSYDICIFCADKVKYNSKLCRHGYKL